MGLLSDTKLVWLQKNTQQYGMDYEETFFSIAKITIIHTLIGVISVRQ